MSIVSDVISDYDVVSSDDHSLARCASGRWNHVECLEVAVNVAVDTSVRKFLGMVCEN